MTGTPNAAFLQAVAEIQSYAQQLAGTPAAGEPQVNAVLLTAKANASQWYDTIFPTYLELPQAIAADGTTIDDGLGLLSRLSGQLEAGSSAALLGQVDQQAASLATTIEALQNQVSGLAGSLQSFHDRVSGDTTALQEAAGVANTVCFVLQIELSALHGKLNSLKSATCPSASDIQACAQQLTQTQDALTAARSDLQTATAASSAAGGATAGAAYLASFWASVGADAGNVLAALGRIQSDPASVVGVDLSTTQQLWSTLKGSFADVGEQLAPMVAG